MWNTATVGGACRACLTGLAGFALVILSASLAKAEYGPRTTIGNNYQQTSDTSSTNGIDQSACTNIDFCYVLFQQAPQQKPLIVQHVSCSVVVSAGVVRGGRVITRKGQALVPRISYVVPISTGGPVWAVNNPVMHLLKSGERAVVLFFSSVATNWQAHDCNISGKLQQP